MKKSSDPNILHLVAKYYLVYGLIHMDSGNYEQSKENYIAAMNVFS